jgi:hypothetical protein
MAHACEKAGAAKCAWCKEADVNKFSTHTCSYGTCT